VTIARISRWPRVRSALLLPAFDAEHIAAIDNSTRKLMNDGQRPLSVGLLVALGHSTIVFALLRARRLGVRGLGGAVENRSSLLHQTSGLVGPVLSGSFLFVIGVLRPAGHWHRVPERERGQRPRRAAASPLLGSSRTAHATS
jgi:High-affinity nickel-transport protein